MTQEMLVMNYLRRHGSITQADATRELGVTRLAAIIWKLRHKRGFEILDKTEIGRNRFGMRVNYARYYLP